MIISKNILLKDVMAGEYSRKKAIQVREGLLAELAYFDLVTIDFSGAVFPPGVADELIGGLAAELTAKRFKAKIKIANESESQLALMRHVIARRMLPQLYEEDNED